MTERSASESAYETGYCKPPRHTQFKPGESGNPKGRRKKKPPVFATALSDALAETAEVRIGSERKVMTRKELIVEQLIAKALKGNKKAIKRLIKLRNYVDQSGDVEPAVIEITEDEARVI